MYKFNIEKKTKNNYILNINNKSTKLSHPTHANWVQIVLWELLAADVEGIEGIGAVGMVFEKVIFGLLLFLHTFVLAEASSG